MEINKAVEELMLYKKIQRRMGFLKQKISELSSRMYSLGGASGIVVDGGVTTKDDKILNLVDSISKYKKELIDEEIHGMCVQNDIERKIYTLREPYCSVLRGYYIECKNLETLAVEQHYTFDGVKSIRYRGVKMYAKLPELYEKTV